MAADPPAVPISDERLHELTAEYDLPYRTHISASDWAAVLARLSAAEARAARAEDRGFNEGIEAAAMVHDKQADEEDAVMSGICWSEPGLQPGDRRYDAAEARRASHRRYATAIRALTRSAPATGQDTPPGESDV